MSAAREPMDAFFAVFNGHINDADKRARSEMEKSWPDDLRRIECIEKEGGGIMAIFDFRFVGYREHPVIRYAALVQSFVNETNERLAG